MKVNLKTTIHNFKGNEMIDDEGRELTVGDVLLASLMGTIESDKSLDGKKKFELYNIGMEVGKMGESIELTAEEITMLKDRVTHTHIPMIIGQIWNALDPVTPKENKKKK